MKKKRRKYRALEEAKGAQQLQDDHEEDGYEEEESDEADVDHEELQTPAPSATAR